MGNGKVDMDQFLVQVVEVVSLVVVVVDQHQVLLVAAVVVRLTQVTLLSML